MIVLFPREKCIDTAPYSRPSAETQLLPNLDASQPDEDRLWDAKSRCSHVPEQQSRDRYDGRALSPVLTPRQSSGVDIIVLNVKKLEK